MGIDWLPTLKRGQPAWNTLCETIGRLSVRGAAVDWQAFLVVDAPRIVPLPTYPFQRQRVLIDIPNGPARPQGRWVPVPLVVRPKGGEVNSNLMTSEDLKRAREPREGKGKE